MKIVNSILGVFVLAILVAIGYKVGQMVIDFSFPTTPTTNIAELIIPEQQSSSALRWSHFPLTVYINGNFVKQSNPSYVNDVKNALNIWQATGIVSFTIVDNPDNADVMIEWTSNLEEKSSDTLGDTDIKFVNVSQFGVIQNASIRLLTKSDSTKLNSNDMVNLALHEIGHAIGLPHTNKDDIMNPVLIIPSKDVKKISADDRNNLQELYKIVPKPDLKITEVNATKLSFSRFGKNYFYLNISINIYNVGLLDAKDFDLQLMADNTVINEGVLQKLELGNSMNVFYGNLKVDRNFTSVQIIIDPQNVIDELNETNNFVTINV